MQVEQRSSFFVIFCTYHILYTKKIRALEVGTYFRNADIGDMFHNFMLSPLLFPYIGVDFKQFPKLKNESNVMYDAYWDKVIKKKGNKVNVGEMWSRMCMGFAPPPYCAVQGMHVAEEVILGNNDS